jgi:hypothetical protein
MTEQTIYNCENCQTRDFLTGNAEMSKHMLEVHGIDTQKVMGRREMTMHMDGKDWYQSNYKFTFAVNPPVVMTYSVRCERDADDPMRF